jgi:hypothetical protein
MVRTERCKAESFYLPFAVAVLQTAIHAQAIHSSPLGSTWNMSEGLGAR